MLELPWGFEIYSLLTRWNPLNLRRPLPQAGLAASKVLVVGLGPAGFTLAHHLMNDGHTVVGIDGLKIEPLPADSPASTPLGKRVPFRPMRDVRDLYEPLDERVMAGFGGVAEYGITVRWDKNFLKIIRLLLERRARVRHVRRRALRRHADRSRMPARLGFDHVALCVGAGKPTVLDIPNGLARGVRAASDFLMALQLTGAAKRDSIANMQMRLPVVVIGGGLTAIDTATESLAYYVVQVEKFLARYETLAGEIGEDAVRDNWDDQEREIAEEFLAHARAIRDERGTPRARARAAHRRAAAALGRRHHRLPPAPHRQPLLHAEPRGSGEGARGRHRLRRRPRAARGGGGQLRRRVRLPCMPGREKRASEHWLPAHTVFVAAGTQPNTVLAREDARDASRSTASISAPATKTARRSSRERSHLQARAGPTCCCRALRRTGASSASSATCIRPTSATW